MDLGRVRAVTLDLDDTLWAVWPAIERAEVLLHQWLDQHAPATASLFGDRAALRAIRNRMETERPDLRHDLSALRRESIRMALQQAGDDPRLAEPAFDVFFDERQRVELFDGAHALLQHLSARYPVVALSNGNADVHRVGIGQYFRQAVKAREVGFAKPDARIFHAAAEAAGVPVEAVLHIGDDATLDALGAMQAGMQAVWLNPGARDWPHVDTPHVPHATVADLAAVRALFA